MLTRLEADYDHLIDTAIGSLQGDEHMLVAAVEAKGATVLGVGGDFDACQKYVKHALRGGDDEFLSCNSVSLARLLPQIAYYAKLAANVPGKHGVASAAPVPQKCPLGQGWHSSSVARPLSLPKRPAGHESAPLLPSGQ